MATGVRTRLLPLPAPPMPPALHNAGAPPLPPPCLVESVVHAFNVTCLLSPAVVLAEAGPFGRDFGITSGCWSWMFTWRAV